MFLAINIKKYLRSEFEEEEVEKSVSSFSHLFWHISITESLI